MHPSIHTSALYPALESISSSCKGKVWKYNQSITRNMDTHQSLTLTRSVNLDSQSNVNMYVFWTVGGKWDDDDVSVLPKYHNNFLYQLIKYVILMTPCLFLGLVSQICAMGSLGFSMLCAVWESAH